MSASCVYGGGSCSASADEVDAQAVSDRTIALIVIFFFIGLVGSILVICCFSRKCPLFGDCERTRGLRKPR